MFPRFFVSGVALATLLAPLTAGAAAKSGDLPSRTVSFGDLNLESHEGVSRLYMRIKSAAKEVCEPLADVSVTAGYLRRRHCEKHAIEQAVEDVGSSQLTTFHNRQANQDAPALLR